jgi:ABC-type branched-subunit amino acid transport system ATPase component
MLRSEDLKKSFDGFVATNGVSLQLAEGSVTRSSGRTERVRRPCSTS